MLNKLIIIGAGGHCRSVLSAAKSMQTWEDYKVIDFNFSKQNEQIMGFNVLPFNKISELNGKNVDFFIAVGDNSLRKSIFKKISNLKCNFVNIQHPNALIDSHSKIGTGNYFGQFSNIGACANMGNFNIINSFGNIEHEVIIGNFNHLAPSSTICGRSELKNGVFIGSKAVVIEKIKIAENTIIGAGSVVLKSVNEANKKLVGIPARIL